VSLFYSLPLKIKQQLSHIPSISQGTYEPGWAAFQQYTKTNATTTTKVTLRDFCGHGLQCSPIALDSSSYLLRRRFNLSGHSLSCIRWPLRPKGSWRRARPTNHRVRRREVRKHPYRHSWRWEFCWTIW
jgi:hypothetical protein